MEANTRMMIHQLDPSKATLGVRTRVRDSMARKKPGFPRYSVFMKHRIGEVPWNIQLLL